MRLLYKGDVSQCEWASQPFALTLVVGRTCLRKIRPRVSKRVVASIHSFAGHPRSLALHEKAGKRNSLSKKAF